VTVRATLTICAILACKTHKAVCTTITMVAIATSLTIIAMRATNAESTDVRVFNLCTITASITINTLATINTIVIHLNSPVLSEP